MTNSSTYTTPTPAPGTITGSGCRYRCVVIESNSNFHPSHGDLGAFAAHGWAADAAEIEGGR